MSSGLHDWKMTKTSNNREGLIQNLYGTFDDYGVFWFSSLVNIETKQSGDHLFLNPPMFIWFQGITHVPFLVVVELIHCRPAQEIFLLQSADFNFYRMIIYVKLLDIASLKMVLTYRTLFYPVQLVIKDTMVLCIVCAFLRSASLILLDQKTAPSGYGRWAPAPMKTMR
jgi:hypothetical protein